MLPIRIHTLKVTTRILALIAELDEFKGAWRALGMLAPERLAALRRVATIESIGASLRLDGSTLTDRGVERVLADLPVAAASARADQDAAGMAKAIELVLGSWQEFALSEIHIKRLHRNLLIHSEQDARQRGEYRADSDSAAPRDTAQQMEELVAWFADARIERRVHPLLLIAVFVVMVLHIQPFHDANGRLSRLLTTLLLLQAGYAYAPYASLDGAIERARADYYLALKQTQATLHTTAPDWQPWLLFFLRALHRQMRDLADKLAREKQIQTSLPELSERILEHARAHGRVSAGAMIALTGASRNTLKDHFRRLVARGHLARHGGGRTTWYVLAS
jgi:Fic family protein